MLGFWLSWAGSWIARAAPFVVLALVAIGLGFLVPDVSPLLFAGLLAAFVLFAVLRLIPNAIVGTIAVVLGAVLVPVMALLGFDALWAQVLPRLGAIASVVVGTVLLAAGFLVYFRSWWVRPNPGVVMAGALSAGLAVGLVLVVPVVWWLKGEWGKCPPTPAAQAVPAVSELDVIVLADQRPDVPAPEQRRGWRIVTWGAQVDGDRLAWVTDPPPEVVSDRADRVALLDIDNAADEPKRWLALADTAAPLDTPVYALLRAPDDAELALWQKTLNSRDPDARPGGVYDVGPVGLDQDHLTDLALRAAVQDPNSDQYLALAARYRPALFFDGSERTPSPLNVDQLLKHGLVRQCPPHQNVRALCDQLQGSDGIDNSADHFAFDPQELADLPDDDPATDPSVTYVNVSTAGNDRPNTIYLDYWWYLPDNPTGAAGGALCGAGFVIAGLTCMDHQSDWEGVAVVVDADAKLDAPPLAVDFAEHEQVVRYTWTALRRLWARDGDLDDFARGLAGPHRPLLRPLVFVASGTHAAYPRSCRHVADAVSCRAGGVPGRSPSRQLSDKSHNGRKPWKGNKPGACRAVCLEALPTHNNGRDAARWNAFHGVWGSKDCALGVLCVKSTPPLSPSLQPRYRRPWCYDSGIDVEGEQFVALPRSCHRRAPTDDEIQHGHKLLALGDSYSSGQGAGDYDPGTDGHGNTCYRSDGAWPQQLARRLRLVRLSPLACSGALAIDVTDGRTKGEAERQISQISRIRNDPDVITLTIGGNDMRFADVLGDCVAGDCKPKYARPSGDVLEERLARLARHLPDVYRAIRRAAPDARVIVADYPRIFPKSNEDHPLGNCSAGSRISADEAGYLNTVTENLDAAIGRAASEAGVEFVDVLEAFDGKELRCEGPSFMNRLGLRPNRFPASYHPNDAGYQRLAAVIATQLAQRRLAEAGSPQAR
jgi:lysophospholipase L1-like esterase